MTMTYWLFLRKSMEGNLSEQEKEIIENNKKDIHLLDSTAADLLDLKSTLNRTIGGTSNMLRRSTKKILSEQTKDKIQMRLPNITRNTSVESKGSTDRSKDISKFTIKRENSKDKLVMIFESTKTPLSNT